MGQGRFRRAVVVVAVIAAVALMAEGLVAAVSRADAAVPPPADALPHVEPAEETGPAPQTGNFSQEPPTSSLVGRKFPGVPDGKGFDAQRSVRDDAKVGPAFEVFDNPDGTSTAVLTSGAVRFRASDGAWRDYDLRVQPQSAAKSAETVVQPVAESGVVRSPEDLVARASDVAAAIAADPTDGLARLGTPLGPIVVGAPDVAGVVEGPVVNQEQRSEVKYATERTGVTVKVGLATRGLEQSLVVDRPSGPSSYVAPLELPPGVAAKQADDAWVDFVDTAGTLVARFGGGVAFDSAKTSDDGAVTNTLVSQDGTTVLIRVAVDPKWWSAKDREFPVTIDPWITSPAIGSSDTYLSAAFPNSAMDGQTQYSVGNFNNNELGRGLLSFGLQGQAWTPGPDIAVLDAKIHTRNFQGQSSAAKNVAILPVTTLYVPNTVTMNTAPPVDGSIAFRTTTIPGGTGGNGGPVQLDATPVVAKQMSTGVPSWGVAVMIVAADENDTSSGKKFYTTEHANQSGDPTAAPRMYITWKHTPPQVSPIKPAADATVATLTPRFFSTVQTTNTQDGDVPSAFRYWFRVTTSPDGNSGTIVWNSGWLTPTANQIANNNIWGTVPENYLQNGGVYYWTVMAWDGYIWNTPTWARKFKVDLRLGTSNPSPMDTMGPLNVNLATGNAAVQVKSITMPSVGGDLGVSYSYNSQAPTEHGLTGQYFIGQAWAGQVISQRRDAVMGFDYGTSPPAPGVPGTNWSARWNGYVTVPTPQSVGAPSGANNDWVFSVSSRAGVKIIVNGLVKYDSLSLPQWWDFGTFHDGTAFGLNPNSPAEIRIEYFADTAGALDIRLRPVSVPVGNISPLGGSWLSVDTPSLPKGWTASADLDGAVPYSQLRNYANLVALSAPDGSMDRFTWTGTAYKPDPGVTGQLTFSFADCCWTYSDNSIIQKFNADGTVAWARSVFDDRQPAAASFTWDSSAPNLPPRLTQIVDPVSGKVMTLRYKGVNDGGSNACPTASGFGTPPAGMLCRVQYNGWGAAAGDTQLFYISGLLARIQDPGDETTIGRPTFQFGYTDGKLDRVMDPRAYDETKTSGASSWSGTTAGYTRWSYDTNNRVEWSQTPTPNPNVDTSDGVRQKHTYDYSTTANSATVTGRVPNGSSYTNAVIRTVEWDDAQRETVDTDASGRTTFQLWDAGADAVSATIDPAGLMTTTVYDASRHLPTDTYGPAPLFGCWNGLVQITGTGCPAVSRTQTRYDEDLQGSPGGLAGEWYQTSDLAGTPKAHTFWTGEAGKLKKNWGSNQPVGITTDIFSGSLTGMIKFPNAGTGANRWKFQIVADNGAQLYIDDQAVVDAWTGSANPGNAIGTVPFDIPNATDWHRIRINYQDTGSLASIQVLMQHPSWSGGVMSDVPINIVTPRYDLVTSTVDPDGRTVQTKFDNGAADSTIGPQYGLTTATIVDPAGLNLKTTDSYEPANTANKFFRHLTHVLPKTYTAAAPDTTVTDEWYPPSGTGSAVGAPSNRASGCPGWGGSSEHQGALLKSRQDAVPDQANTQVKTTIIYNKQGRTAFELQAGDTNYGCTIYDAQLRVSKEIDSSGKPSSFSYAFDGTVTNTFTDSESGTNRTTTTKIDLLGRQVSYTDANGTVSTTTYDIAGRVVDQYRQLPGQANQRIQSATYDHDGRILTSTEYLSTGAGRTTTYTYDTAGRPETTNRPTSGANPIVTTTTRDPQTGRVANLKHSLSTTVLAEDGYGYSAASKITSHASARGGSAAYWRLYGYDQAGRLTTAADVGGATRNYSYDWNTNRCNDSTTACNGNSGTGGTGAYRYDKADRIVSSPKGSGYTYDEHGNLKQYTMTSTGQTIKIEYDANNHAKKITTLTGSTTNQTVTETLDPAGRVLRRHVTGTDAEDTAYGYNDDTDSPAYTYPYGNPGGTITSYLGDSIITGTTIGYQLYNQQGDIVGTTTIAGVLTVAPVADEFGNLASIPATRLGWLGQHDRFTVAQSSALVRMGHRLYDPEIGRFLGADPVWGGSANSYDYVNADPVNATDLDGTQGPGTGCFGKFKGKRLKKCIKKQQRAMKARMKKGSGGNPFGGLVRLAKTVGRGIGRAAKATYGCAVNLGPCTDNALVAVAPIPIVLGGITLIGAGVALCAGSGGAACVASPLLFVGGGAAIYGGSQLARRAWFDGSIKYQKYTY